MNIFGFSIKLAGLKEKLKENGTFFDWISKTNLSPASFYQFGIFGFQP
jgi:hypothetical protein